MKRNRCQSSEIVFGLLIGLSLLLCVSLTACHSQSTNQADSETVVQTDPATSDTTSAGETATETTTEETATETVTESATETEAMTGWTPDTGTFNAGIVSYEKVVETEILSEYPDADLGKPMQGSQAGVNTLFHADFNDNDVFCSEKATTMKKDTVAAKNGQLYIPYADGQLGGPWNTWTTVEGAPLHSYKQVQLSADWTIQAVGDGAWMTAFWGCYVSNFAGKIPDNAGDGLWISFQPNGNKVTVYHPDKNSWPAGFVDVPVEKGLLNGWHHVDILCEKDYTTTVLITPEGGAAPRAVCTITFTDGKIHVYNEEKKMVKESACTTDSLKGDHFVLFGHGGGGAIVDDVAVLGASVGKAISHTTYQAKPEAGHTFGLDITDKTDLVSICYSVWFDAILGNGTEPVKDWHNITEIQAGKQEWGPVPSFHYWAKPAAGYYRSSDTTVIRRHMTELYTAGVDFIIIDLTNAGDGYLGTSNWNMYIQQPMDAICDTIMEMRCEGQGTPYVVFWVGDGEGPLYQKLYDHYCSAEKWKDCFVYWDEKPLLLTTHMDPRRFPLRDLFTVRAMWGLTNKHPTYHWSFLNVNNYGTVSMGPDHKPEQVSVAVASQETYMSRPTAHGREGGLFWYLQWHYAFETHPKVVTLTWWNEWTAQRLQVDGEFCFTDNYNQEYSRDIEPMTGGHGDQYYQWMIQYISAYKGGLECPVLVEDAVRPQVEQALEDARK